MSVRGVELKRTNYSLGPPRPTNMCVWFFVQYLRVFVFLKHGDGVERQSFLLSADIRDDDDLAYFVKVR